MKYVNIITNIICIIVIVVMAVLLALNWNSLPDEVPTHFAANGEPDAFGGKGVLLIEPILAAAAFVLISVCQRFPQMWNFPVKITAENKEREYFIAHIMITAIKVLVTLLLFTVFLTSIISGFPAWPMKAGVIITLAVTAAGIALMFKFK